MARRNPRDNCCGAPCGRRGVPTSFPGPGIRWRRPRIRRRAHSAHGLRPRPQPVAYRSTVPAPVGSTTPQHTLRDVMSDPQTPEDPPDSPEPIVFPTRAEADATMRDWVDSVQYV